MNSAMEISHQGQARERVAPHHHIGCTDSVRFRVRPRRVSHREAPQKAIAWRVHRYADLGLASSRPLMWV